MLVVGMFDDADSLEEGIERLTAAGLDENLQRQSVDPSRDAASEDRRAALARRNGPAVTGPAVTGRAV